VIQENGLHPLAEGCIDRQAMPAVRGDGAPDAGEAGRLGAQGEGLAAEGSAEGETMLKQRLGLAFFALGVVILHLYTTLLYLWALLTHSLRTFPLMLPVSMLSLIGFTPPIGALLLVAGGLIYGQQARG
jgi:hypothetical protein